MVAAVIRPVSAVITLLLPSCVTSREKPGSVASIPEQSHLHALSNAAWRSAATDAISAWAGDSAAPQPLGAADVCSQTGAAAAVLVWDKRGADLLDVLLGEQEARFRSSARDWAISLSSASRISVASTERSSALVIITSSTTWMVLLSISAVS